LQVETCRLGKRAEIALGGGIKIAGATGKHGPMFVFGGEILSDDHDVGKTFLPLGRPKPHSSRKKAVSFAISVTGASSGGHGENVANRAKRKAARSDRV
jgi:hypothetical protein